MSVPGAAILLLFVLLTSAPAAMAAPAASPAPAAPVSGSAGPSTTTGPSLSIAVDNGRSTATLGDRLDYTVTVRNLGSAAIKNLYITQTMPTGLKFGSADRSGVARSGAVSWRTELPARGSTTFHTSTTVTTTPTDLLRLASVACAATGPDAAPVVCASHSDALPAAAQLVAGGGSGTTDRTWWYVGAAVLLIVLIAGILLLRRRPRRHRAIS